jgi:hypothetical protein
MTNSNIHAKVQYGAGLEYMAEQVWDKNICGT